MNSLNNLAMQIFEIDGGHGMETKWNTYCRQTCASQLGLRLEYTTAKPLTLICGVFFSNTKAETLSTIPLIANTNENSSNRRSWSDRHAQFSGMKIEAILRWVRTLPGNGSLNGDQRHRIKLSRIFIGSRSLRSKIHNGKICARKCSKYTEDDNHRTTC